MPSLLMKVNNTMENQGLLIKAEKEAEKAEVSDYKFINEYTEALFDYCDLVWETLIDAVAATAEADTNKIRKSYALSKQNLIRIPEMNDEEKYFYKSIFSKAKKTIASLVKKFKKFNINKGNAPQPFSFKGKFIYNPETKNILTNKEYDNLSDGIVNFLGEYIENPKEEMIVRASFFGKIIKMMEAKGIPKAEMENMSWEELEKNFGEIPSNKTEYNKRYSLNKQELEAIDYAQQNAGKYISVRDSDLKNDIVNTTRDIITEGLAEGKKAHEMVSEFYHTTKEERQRGIDVWNRNIDRIIATETGNAQQNGYLLSTKKEDKAFGKKKSYFVYSGAYNPEEKPNEPCNIWIGKIALLVDEPLADDKIKDEYADTAIWAGKTNVGRKKADWWMCIKTHPYCRHTWQAIDPSIQEWSREDEMVIYKED